MNELKSIKIDKEIYKKFQIYCIEHDLKVKSIVEKLISEFLKNNMNNDNK